MVHTASSSSTPPATTPPASATPEYARLEEEEAEPLIGYPAIATTVDGQPIYAYLPSALPRLRRPHCRRGRTRSCACFGLFLLVLAAVAAFFIWPRSLEMTVTDLTLGKIHFNIKRGDSLIPQVFLNITLNLRLRARNPNFFGVTYETATVRIFFEGDEIGEAQSHGGDLEALSTSYVDATLELNGYHIANNVLMLLADVASGNLPLQTVTVFDGHINVHWFELPLEGKVACNLVVDPQDQVLLSQDCDV